MRYIYDITQLVHWPGNLTGIPRVMDELALRFLKYSPEDTVFVSWVKEVGEMCEVNFGTTRSHRGNGIDYIAHGSSSGKLAAEEIDNPTQSKTPSIAVKRALKSLATRTGVNQTDIYLKAKRALHRSQALSYKVYTPEPEDKFFIPWGEWWDQNWLNKVASYAENKVSIYPVCHDILPMVVPQFSGNSSSLANFISQIFPISKVALVPSQSTKKDLILWMNNEKIRVPDIEVVSWGEDFSIQEKSTVNESILTKKYGVKKDNFIITVSTIEPRKNHTLLYYAYKLAISRGFTPPKLLIIGRVGHDTKEIIKFITEDPEINQLIKICDFVDDNELNWLYNNCMFTVSSSFYEGLGMSILESIMRGKPGICSNSSSLGEISDRYVLHFNPASTDECLDAIMKMSDPKTRSKYEKNIKSYNPKSWDDTYGSVVKIMEAK